MKSLIPEARPLIVLAIPLVVARLSHVLMGFVDTWMAGTLGTDEVAALGLGHTIWFLGFIVAMGVLMGIEPMLARAHGAGDAGEVRECWNAGRWLALGLAVPLTAIALVGPSLAMRMGQPAHLEQSLQEYLWIIALAAVPALLFQVAANAISSLEHSRPLLVISLAGNVLNVVTNFTLVHGIGPLPALGIRGIALATVISSVGMLGLMLYMIHTSERTRLLRERWRLPKGRALGRLLTIGVPVGAQYGLEVASFSGATFMVGLFGAAALAAHQVSLSVISVSFVVALGVGAAGGIRVAGAIGRGDTEAADRVGKVAFLIGALVATLSAVILILARAPIAAAFLDDPAARAVAVSMLLFAALFQVADGIQAVGFGLLRGLGDTRVPMLFNLIGYWFVGLPGGFWLAWTVFERPEPIWGGLAVALFLVATAALIRFFRTLREMAGHGPAQ